MWYLSVQKLELLSFGYVRQNYYGVIPIVLSKVIGLFYDEYYRWHISKGKTMKKFLETKNNAAIYASETLSIKDIVFKFSLCPNGWNTDEVGKCLYFIETAYFPQNIEYVVMYIELIEERTKTKIKRIRKLKHIQDTTGWGVNRKNTIHLKDLKQYESLDFAALIDIKHIKYKKQKEKTKKIENVIANTKMSKKYRFCWNIDKILLDKLENMKVGESIWSTNFDGNNWCIELYCDALSELRVSLNCLYFPFGVQYLRVKFKAYSECINFLDEDNVETFTFGRRCDAMKIHNDGFNHGLKGDGDIESVPINIILEIQQMSGDENNVIHSDDWSKYGVE